MKKKYRRDPEQVREILEWLGAQLMYIDQPQQIELSHEMVRQIIDILSSLPEGKKGRPKEWSFDTEITAVFDMLNGKPVNVVAREIAKQTGQPEPSADRRLRALKKSPRFTNWQHRPNKKDP